MDLVICALHYGQFSLSIAQPDRQDRQLQGLSGYADVGLWLMALNTSDIWKTGAGCQLVVYLQTFPFVHACRSLGRLC